MQFDLALQKARIKRRPFLQLSLVGAMTPSLWADAAGGPSQPPAFDAAADVLARVTDEGQVRAAVMCVRHRGAEQVWAFGEAASPDSIFLLASISKPMTAAALMIQHDAGKVRLDDPVVRYLPELAAADAPRDGRERMLVWHLLTHVSGLPDQLPENRELRSRHAPLAEFVAAALRTPLHFPPGTQYSYSSMGILLAAEIAERLSGKPLRQLMAEEIFGPLEMRHSALGLGPWKIEQTMLGQIEDAAEESGAGDPQSKDWDWNSPYWRDFGAPWGGVHGSARDVARFFSEFLHPSGKMLSEASTELMCRNHNPPGLTPRGLGFGLGKRTSSDACSERTLGHTGSTGTLAWADPLSDTVCVILTTLPGEAATPHPRARASNRVAQAVTFPVSDVQ